MSNLPIGFAYSEFSGKSGVSPLFVFCIALGLQGLRGTAGDLAEREEATANWQGCRFCSFFALVAGNNTTVSKRKQVKKDEN